MRKLLNFLLVLVLVGLVAGGVWKFYIQKQPVEVSQEDADVYANKVADIVGSGVNGSVQNRYSGVVETQQTLDVPYDESKKVKTLFVQEGDHVNVGDPLFEFDTEDIQMSLDQAQLDLDRLISQQEQNEKQLATLQADKANASEDQQLDYAIQIQSMQAAIKENEYNQKSKNAEIERIRASLTDNQVYAELTGRVLTVNETPGYDNNGNRKPFITIITEGDFRIKGTVNETNIWSIAVGSQVLIRSRIHEDETWVGTITLVDTQNKVSGGDQFYYGPQGETSTKYPFYVELDNSEGLMLGQHVFIEMDFGQEEEVTGLWLDAGYIAFDEEGNPFVWLADATNHLAKRPVTLGEMDYELYRYEILEGLGEEDYIAYPDEACEEGATVYKFDASARYGGME